MPAGDPAHDWKAWRKQERARLLAARLAVCNSGHARWSHAVNEHLVQGFPQLSAMTIGFYWPYQREFDPRHAIHHFRQGGARVALPVVTAKHAPLIFREWRPGITMIRGVFDLPAPESTAVVQPQALLMPPVGFDEAGFRLGYGGGYFDRTLAAMTLQPLKIGLAFELSRVQTIHPQPFDIAMDFVITEAGIFYVNGDKLQAMQDSAECCSLAAEIIQKRRLTSVE